MGLKGLLEELHADREVPASRLEPPDHGELIQMILVAIVALADEDHAAVGNSVEQRLHVGERGKIQHAGVGVQALIVADLASVRMREHARGEQ